MIAKISMTAAFLLIVAPPMACASVRSDSSPAPVTWQAHRLPLDMVLAQDGQSSMGTTDSDNDNGNDNDNDNDSNDNADDNQNADSSQTDENATSDNPPMIPPTVLGQPDNEQQEPRQAPMNAYPQPVNPYQ